jgi:GT2 family glycosyltransferase
MMVGIIIPTKENTTELFKCIDSIFNETSVPYRLYIADTGSTDEVKELTRMHLIGLYGDDYKLVEYDYYNFAKINNDMVKNHLDSDIDMVLFCNNDIEIMTEGLIDRMVEVAGKNKAHIGTVGCRLVYPNDTIQHDGQNFILPKSKNLFPCFTHINLGKDHTDSVNDRHRLTKVNGNTFALCLMYRSLFENIGMLNEDYIECFEDVELNMICNLRGKVNVVIESDQWAYHHESLSRGKSKEAQERLTIDYRKLYYFTINNMKFK